MTRTYPNALLSFRHRFACCDEARRRPTTRASASRYSRGHERLRRAAFAIPASTPAPSAEKVLLTDFCNRPTSRAPATDRSIPGVFGPLSRSAHIQRSHLRRTRRGVSHLTVRSALWSNSRSRFPPIRRSRASLNPGGLRYRRALEGTPPVPRRCLPRARSARRPLTPHVATGSASFATACFRRPLQPTLCSPPEPPLFKAPSRALLPCDSRRLPSTSARSIRRPLSETTNLEREPATGLGALPPFNPASDALSPPRSEEEVARPRPLPNALHVRALLATRRSSTSAIQTTCKHDLRTSKPGAATVARLSPSLHLADRSTFRMGHRRFTRQ